MLPIRAKETHASALEPGSRTGSPTYAHTVTTPGGGSSSYLFNGVVGQCPLSVMQAPADLIYIREENFANRYASQRPCRNRTDGRWYGANLLFCDGHARWMKKSQVRFSHLGLVVTPHRPLSTDPTLSVNEGNAGLPAAF